MTEKIAYDLNLWHFGNVRPTTDDRYFATLQAVDYILVLHPSMLEPEKCPSEANFWCLSMLDARIFIFEHARARSMLDFLILDTN